MVGNSGHVPLERTTRSNNTTGMTRHNDRYDYAPLSYPQIAQLSFFCRDCGSFVGDLERHDEYHALIDSLAQQNVEAIPLEEEKVSEPVKPAASRAKKVAE